MKASVASSATGYSPSSLGERRLRLWVGGSESRGRHGRAEASQVRLLPGRVGPRRGRPAPPGRRLRCGLQCQGATREGIVEAAKEDYRQLLLRVRVRQEQEELSLDELPEHSAIVDNSGTIVAVNKAWKRFAKDNGAADLSKVSEGANYLDVCERATGEHSPYAQSFGEGLRSVLCSREERFAMEYPCHSPTERRWFVGRVERFAEGDLAMALVAHEKLTLGASRC